MPEDGITLDLEKVQSITDWESEQNRMLLSTTGLTLYTEISGQEFVDLCEQRGSKGVNVEWRKDWLVANGYNYSRKRMLDPELPNTIGTE